MNQEMEAQKTQTPTQLKVDESTIFEVEPTEVVINEERPRHRREMGEVQKLVESIKAYVQLQPIVISRNNELIAGGRRLAACLLGGFKAKVCYRDTVDPILMRELELEENLQRKALTPAEESLAVDELVKLKQQLHGKATSGREGGITLDDIASMVGKSKGYVIEAMQIAESVRDFPELGECKTKSEIKSAARGLQRVAQNMEALVSYESTIKQTDEFVLVNRKAEDWLAGLGDKSVDLFFTDPPYGIEIHDIAMTIGGETGGERTSSGIKYDDSEENAKQLMGLFAKESYRIIRDTGHAYIFCAPSHFWWLRERMGAAGWLVAPRPIIWIKRESGQNNQPEHWFSSAYEFILFARKTNSSIIIQGRPDWIQCDPVLPSQRIHQAEKPVELCKELISRVCMPGSYMIDPCMGSGAIIEAGVQMKVLSLGCELSTEAYANAMARLVKWKENK
jgi:site-specific DNA-methyltransferase (adenine-specific)